MSGADPRWTQAQNRAILNYAGRIHSVDVLAKVNAVGPPRTLHALGQHAHSLGLKIRKRGPEPPPPRHWSQAEDAIIRRLARASTALEIATAVNAHLARAGSERRRTESGVNQRANDLRVSLAIKGLSPKQIVSILPITDDTLIAWISSGLITAKATQRPYGRRQRLRIAEAELERFILAEGWRFNWRAVRAGRWRDVARAAWIAHPMLTTEQAAAWLQWPLSKIWRYLKEGQLSGAIRVSERGAWRIPLTVLDTVGRSAS